MVIVCKMKTAAIDRAVNLYVDRYHKKIKRVENMKRCTQ
jgi:hypothetical protein